MVRIDRYMDALTCCLQETFGSRLCYVGLQGSYLRNEAHEGSDIDVMLILDRITPETLDRYRQILIGLGHYDVSCGFVCGKEEMRNWNTLEICHVLHTTKDWYGVLADFVPEYNREDVVQYTKMSLNNLSHGLCHSYVHSGKESALKMLPGMYKGAFFILQSLQYLKTGEYVQTKRELLPLLNGMDREVLEASMHAENPLLQTEDSFQRILDWCTHHSRSL